MSGTYTVGDGKTYSTIQAAIDAIPGDLSSSPGVHTVEVYTKAAGYAETLDTVTGFTNQSATDYIHIKAMVSHGGQRESGIVVDVGSASVGFQIYMGDYTRLSGFCIKSSAGKTLSDTHIIYAHGTVGGYHIYDNIIYDCDAVASYAVFGMFVRGVNCRVYNNVLANIGTNAFTAFGIYMSGSATSGNQGLVANNTVLDTSASSTNIGIHNNLRNYIDFYNNYVGDCGQDYFTNFAGTGASFDYNISSDASAGSSGGNLSSKASANQFVSNTPASFDVHLKLGADCIRTGQDLSSYFTTDFEGDTRSNYDTGADEYTAAPVTDDDGAAMMQVIG